jgi:hypothetical protein
MTVDYAAGMFRLAGIGRVVRGDPRVRLERVDRGQCQRDAADSRIRDY